VTATIQRGLPFAGGLVWLGLALTACGGTTAATHDGAISDAGHEKAPDMDAPGGGGGDAPKAMDASLMDAPTNDAPGGDAVGTCSGPYPPAGYLANDSGVDAAVGNSFCVSDRALVVCTGPQGGTNTCLSDKLQCSPGEHNCVNACASDEYAAECGGDAGAVDGGPPYPTGCRANPGGANNSYYEFFCCKCPS
jgi:hypothetical protein